jgi:hypothetical protein
VAVVAGAGHHDLCVDAGVSAATAVVPSNRWRVRKGEHLSGVVIRDDSDVDVVLAKADDGAALGECDIREARGIVGDAVQRAEPQDKA